MPIQTTTLTFKGYTVEELEKLPREKKAELLHEFMRMVNRQRRKDFVAKLKAGKEVTLTVQVPPPAVE